jgi:flagellar FliL protein
MAEEQKQPEVEAEGEEKKKSPMVKIILLAVGITVLLIGSVVGTLFASGFFSKKAPSADELLDAHENAGAGGHGAAAGGHGKPADKAKDAKKDDSPQKKAIPEEAATRFEKSYMELDDKKALVTNLSGSRKVMQVSLSLMTMYDERVFKNVEKHRAALRSGLLDVLRQVTEAELAKPDFRNDLALRLRDRINAELERLENFGGIEEVFFTEFVVQ